MSNEQIRTAMRFSGVYQWEVARQMNVSEVTFCRWLRTELPKDKEEEVFKAIDNIVAERRNR